MSRFDNYATIYAFLQGILVRRSLVFFRLVLYEKNRIQYAKTFIHCFVCFE